MKSVAKLVVAILPVLLIIGCGSKEVKEEAAPVGENIVIDQGGATTGEETGGTRLDDGQATEAEAGAAAETEAVTDADKDLLAERKVYFDFDRSEILDAYKEILKAHAKHLVANPNASVSVEGHCDERGTREYNMALGERRAYSVLQFLTLQGVSKSQINTVSFGEERPDVEGHDESAWKWNRRSVMVYSE